MKKLYIASLIALAGLGANAQSKLSPAANQMLNEYNAAMSGISAKADDAQLQYVTDQSIIASVILDDPSQADQIAQLGYEIIDVVDHVALVIVPLNSVDQLVTQDNVRYVEFGEMVHPTLNNARAASNVDAIHDGTGDGLNAAYTGKGVVVGLFDQGLDPNHINFRDRVVGISRYTSSSGTSTDYLTATKIANFTTDSSSATHGTHVLGIMAGGYKGDIKEYSETHANPYYGVATDADIYVGCGSLYSNNTLAAVKKVIDYASSANQPAVINLSLGSNTGTHDGLDSYGRTLDNYGQKAIIVVAAGNEGDVEMGISKTFTADDNALKTFFCPFSTTSAGTTTHSNSSFSGTLEIYSNSNATFTLKVVVVEAPATSADEPTITNSYEITKAGTYTISNTTLEGFTDAVGSSATMSVITKTDASYLSNRYQAQITFNNMKMTNVKTGTFIGLVIEGDEGQTINGYAHASSTLEAKYVYGSFWNRGFKGWDTGSANGTISNLACGKNVIVVGSYNTSSQWQTLNGTTNDSYYTIGDISPFSSYGTLYDGRNLPHICAPGSVITSSYNTYYGTLSTSTVNGDMTARTTDDSRNNYWGYMQGTSMATPFVAGTIALWLEADPSLTVADVQEILAKTAIRDSYVEAGDQVQWGAGKLDALAGLKEVLSRNSGVGTILADTDKAVVIKPNGSAYDIYVAGETALRATLYSLGGTAVASASAQGNELTLETSAVSAGIYLLSIDGANTHTTRKIVVR